MNLHKRRRVSAVVDNANFLDPPIDFSFLNLTSPCDAIDEIPRIRNVTLKKGETRKFKSNTLHLNNNALSDCTGIVKALSHYFVSLTYLRWINLSFNQLLIIPDEILELPHLQILYFHSNLLTSFNHVSKLQLVPTLRSLTLHGNPVEKEDNYRTQVLVLLPNLRSLDFSDVTSADIFVAEATNTMNMRIMQRRIRAAAYD